MTRSPFLATIVSILLIGALVASCGKKEAEQQQQAQQQTTQQSSPSDPADQMKQAADQMSDMFGGNQEPVPPISYKTLQKYLPASYQGMKTEGPEGESMTMGQWSYSQAKISFDGDAGQRVHIEVIDYAYIKMLYAAFQMAWRMKLSKESSRGYERTTTIGTWPAIEKWQNESKSMELSVLVGDRFIVQVHTNDLPEGTAKEIIQAMDLATLAKEKAS